MLRTLRDSVLALLVIGLTLALPGAAGAAKTTRLLPDPDAGLPSYTRAEARDVLSNARSVLQGDPASAPTASTDPTVALRELFLARPSLTGADRRSANRLLARRHTSAQVQTQAAAAATITCSTNFCLHYGSSTTSSWVNTTLSTLEHVWSTEVAYMGQAPLPDDGDGSSDNPDDRLDVFLTNLAPNGIYGFCQADSGQTSSQAPVFCALDDDFARSEYGAPPISSLRVTAAHEFFHAIQYALDDSEDLWFMEGSATWMEDVVYPTIHDNYQYLSTSPIRYPRTSLTYGGTTFPYGSFIFFTYSVQRLGDAAVKDFWHAAVGAPTSLQSIYSVVGAPAWAAFFATFGSWNTVPLHSYPHRVDYPAAAWWERKTLSNQATTTGLRSVQISRLGNAAVLLTPSSTLAPGKHLLIEIDAPDTSLGSTALLQRRFRDGHVTHTVIPLSSAGNARPLVTFNRNVLSSIVVVLSNTNRAGSQRLFKLRAGVR